MGNRKNRAPRRKYWRKKVLSNINRKSANQKISTSNEANNDVTTEDITVVDVVSVLGPIPDVQYNHNYSSDPITPITENSILDVQDPLLVVKSEIESLFTSKEQSNECFNVGAVKAELETEPISNDNVIHDAPHLIEIKNKCRLCLTKEESTWIEIFSSEPYPFANVHEITPSNILEIIEAFTTIKISENDSLPGKLCLKCFQSLRFVYKFRETSLRSQNSLNLEVNALSKPILKRIPKPILKPIPKPKLKPIPKPICNLDKDKEKFGQVQCELCGVVFEKYKPLQYHLNRHNGVRPFTCTEPHCDKSFFSPPNLKLHIFNVHSIDPKFKCDLCEKTYNKAEKLKIHRAVHFPPTIPCSICGKLLRSQGSIRKHRACHAERLHKCNDCGKSFQNAYTLKVHQRIHTNEKPFICCKCGETFAHNCLLKSHTEKKHAD